MRISDWSSDVCSSDLSDEAPAGRGGAVAERHFGGAGGEIARFVGRVQLDTDGGMRLVQVAQDRGEHGHGIDFERRHAPRPARVAPHRRSGLIGRASCRARVFPYGYISWAALPHKKKQKTT